MRAWVSGARALMARMPSMPLIPGNPTSNRTTRGGVSERKAVRASSQLANIRSQLRPSIRSMTWATVLRKVELSSTSQILTSLDSWLVGLSGNRSNGLGIEEGEVGLRDQGNFRGVKHRIEWCCHHRWITPILRSIESWFPFRWRTRYSSFHSGSWPGWSCSSGRRLPTIPVRWGRIPFRCQ